jgi:Asp-tRNA(Asn)/Glu-tRNA(Gln) amidotransferase B subunit
MTALALLATLAFSCAAFSQQASPPPIPRMTDVQIQSIFTGISKHTARIEPMIQQLHPAEWVEKGAPQTYVAQWNSTIEQLNAIQTEMAALAQRPDQLVELMKALFRVQASQKVVASLMEGLRRYQNPALAELIESVAAEDQSSLDTFERYLVELATDRQQQYDVVEHEAQRCRSTLFAPPPSTSKTTRRP